MSLDDIDFEYEWDKFKRIVNTHEFTITQYISKVASICTRDGKQLLAINKKVLDIFKEMDLFDYGKTNAIYHIYVIKPKHLCSMSNPSIQNDKEDLDNEYR